MAVNWHIQTSPHVPHICFLTLPYTGCHLVLFLLTLCFILFKPFLFVLCFSTLVHFQSDQSIKHMCMCMHVFDVSCSCVLAPNLPSVSVPPPFASAWWALSVNLKEKERVIELSLACLLFTLCALFPAAAEAQMVYTSINIILCAYIVCVMEEVLPRVLCIWMKGFLQSEQLHPRKSMTVLSRNRVLLT